MESWLNLLAAGLAVVGALSGLAQYLRFRNKRERQADVGKAFASVLVGLGSDSTIERLASAALLRRFWDKDSEYGEKLLYAEDAVKVAAAILKEEPTGAVQKLLADELATAPAVTGRSFQRANLRDAYWGMPNAQKGQPQKRISLRGADFFRADLSLASLKNADLEGAQFREAHLVEAVLKGAICTKANFQFANLRGARFDGAILDGASFKDASHVPHEILIRLNDDGVYKKTSPVPEAAERNADLDDFSVFISSPAIMSASDRLVLEQLVRGIANSGAVPHQFLREEYGQAPPLEEITRRVATSRGMVVYGPPQLTISSGLLRGGTTEEQHVDSLGLPTPWNQVEAGIAVGLGKPVLVIGNGAEGGIFDLHDDPGGLDVVDVTQPGMISVLDKRLKEWLKRLQIATHEHEDLGVTA